METNGNRSFEPLQRNLRKILIKKQIVIKNRDIIFVGIQAIDGNIGSNAVNIATEMSRHNRVLYVNYTLSRITKRTESDDPNIQKRIRILKGQEPDLVQLSDNLWTFYPKCVLESISQLPFDGLFNFLNKINNARFSKEIKRAIDILNFKNYFIINDSDVFRSLYLRENLNPEVYIYYTRDNLKATPFFKRQGTRLERQLMKKVDFVIANSSYLADYAREFNPKSYNIGQGCDVNLFDKKLISKIPDDIAKIDKPIIGYIGVLYSLRLDIEILVHLAKNKPEYQLVLVGPEDEDFLKSELHQLSNVHFLGNKTMEELPSYLNQFDVCLNPQTLNEVTIGNYPRKIDEYLAMGKPVVATKTITMEMFADYTYLATTKEDYVQLVEKALQENTVEKENEREKFARNHTWTNNVEEIYKLITNFLQTPKDNL